MWAAVVGHRPRCGTADDPPDGDDGRQRPEVGTPKSRAGVRRVALDAGTVAALRSWKATQAAERLMIGQGWQGGDLVVTEPDGSAVHPQVLTRRFGVIVKRAGLPTIRLHDVRHSYATAALAAGVPVKVLSQRIGHADVSVTLAVYAHVMPGDDEAAADLVAAAITGRDQSAANRDHYVTTAVSHASEQGNRRGDAGNRTRVEGFAGPCLNHSATSPGDGCSRRAGSR